MLSMCKMLSIDSNSYTKAWKYWNSSGKISKIKSFIGKCDWKEIWFFTEPKVWKKFKSNNKSIALNILFLPNNREEIK